MAKFGFEVGGWTLVQAGASLQSAVVRSGRFALQMYTDATVPPGGLGAVAHSPVFAVDPDTDPHDVTVWAIANQDAVDNGVNFAFDVAHFPFGTSQPPYPSISIGSVNGTQLSTTEWRQFTFQATPVTKTTNRLALIAPTAENVATGTPTVWIDDVEYRTGSVAIELAERASDAVVALLKAELGNELAAIDTARGDSITMDVPDSDDYYQSPDNVIAGDTSHVEVYEGEYELLHPQSDIAAVRAAFDVPLVIRLTWFNRDGDTRDTMRKRGQRYACGIYNAIMQNHQLADSDDATVAAWVDSVSPPWVVDDPTRSGLLKGRIEVSIRVKVEEYYT